MKTTSPHCWERQNAQVMNWDQFTGNNEIRKTQQQQQYYLQKDTKRQGDLHAKCSSHSNKKGGRQVCHPHHAFLSPKPCPSSWKQESLTSLVKMSGIENHNPDTTTQCQVPSPHSYCKNLLCPGRIQDTTRASKAWGDTLQVPDLCPLAQHTWAWAQLQWLNTLDAGWMPVLSRDGWDHHDKLCQWLFPLFCSSPAHPDSLLWQGEEEAQILLAEEHRCHIFFSSHARPLVFLQGVCCYRWNGLMPLLWEGFLDS